MAKTEAQLIAEMREQGKQYLRNNPKAFGGGIDPETGIRYVDGKRVSVEPEYTVNGVQMKESVYLTMKAKEQIRIREQHESFSKGVATRNEAINKLPVTGARKAELKKGTHYTISGFPRNINETDKEYEARHMAKGVPQNIKNDYYKYQAYKNPPTSVITTSSPLAPSTTTAPPMKFVPPTSMPETQGLFGKVGEVYGKVETKASQKLYDITGFSEEQHEKQKADVLASEAFLKSNIAESTEFLKSKGVPSWIASTGGWIANVGATTGTMIAGAVGSIGKKTIDKPITTTGKYVAIGAAGAGAGFILGGSGTLLAGTKAGAVIIPAAKVAGAGLGLVYGAGVYKEVKAAPSSFERGGILGETILETTAFAGGYVSGKSGAAKVGDIWRTKGRVEVPVEDVVLKDVLVGKTKFVESKSYGYKGATGKQKQAFDVKVFEKGDSAYHVTPETFWKSGEFKTVAGTSEFKGLYVAPSPSPYFGKVGTTPKSYKISLFGKGFEASSKPSVAKIEGLKFTTKLSKTKAFVTGVKPEAEAVVPVGVSFGKVSGKTYFKFGGRRFPIDVFKSTGGKGVGVSAELPSGYSAYKIPTYSLITPATVGVSSIISSKPAQTPSYTPSKPSTQKYYAPSKPITTLISSYKPSAPSKPYPSSKTGGIVQTLPSYFAPSKPSAPSYIPSKPKPIVPSLPSYTPSKPKTITPSLPSYFAPSKPSAPVSSIPSYKPSKPSAVPSYFEPVRPSRPSYKPSKPYKPTPSYIPSGASYTKPSTVYSNIYGGSSSRGLLPSRTSMGILPKFPKIGERSGAKKQIYKQPTKFQTSFTGSILRVRGKGLAPGGLSIRGILDSKEKDKKKRRKLWWE